MKSINVNIKKENSATFFVISPGKSPLWTMLILGVLAAIGYLIPVGIFVASFITDIEIGFGFIFAMMLGFGTGIFFTRLLLWNTCGSETFEITSSGMHYYCDYKLFKDNRQKFGFKSLKVEGRVPDTLNPEDLADDSKGVIAVEDQEHSLTTSIELPVELLSNTLTKLEMELDFHRLRKN